MKQHALPQWASYTRRKADGKVETWFAELVPKSRRATVDIVLSILPWVAMIWFFMVLLWIVT